MWSDHDGPTAAHASAAGATHPASPGRPGPGSEGSAVGYRPAVSTTARWPRELFLVRHGESAGNVARDLAESSGEEWIDIADRDMDVPLSDRGIEQARALGRWLKDLGSRAPTVAIASPYRRAADTATVAIGSSGLGINAVLDERLREREFGILDRLTRKGIIARHPEEAEARIRVGKFYYRPPGGESWCDVALRVRSAVDTIAREYAGEPVLVVAHEVVILMFRYVLEQLTEAQVLAIGAETALVNCGVTEFVVDPADPGRMRRTAFNTAVALESEEVTVTREPDVPGAPR
jgi:2,3-bisphosphoglycerate-dependent phosphoglycerate mutase